MTFQYETLHRRFTVENARLAMLETAEPDFSCTLLAGLDDPEDPDDATAFRASDFAGDFLREEDELLAFSGVD